MFWKSLVTHVYNNNIQVAPRPCTFHICIPPIYHNLSNSSITVQTYFYGLRLHVLCTISKLSPAYSANLLSTCCPPMTKGHMIRTNWLFVSFTLVMGTGAGGMYSGNSLAHSSWELVFKSFLSELLVIQQSYNVKFYLGTKNLLLVIRNYVLSGYVLTSCHCT